MSMVVVREITFDEGDLATAAEDHLRELRLGWHHIEVTESVRGGIEEPESCRESATLMCLDSEMNSNEIEAMLAQIHKRPSNRRETLRALRRLRAENLTGLVCVLGYDLPDRWGQKRALVFTSRDGVYSLFPRRHDFTWLAGTLVLAA